MPTSNVYFLTEIRNVDQVAQKLYQVQAFSDKAKPAYCRFSTDYIQTSYQASPLVPSGV